MALRPKTNDYTVAIRNNELKQRTEWEFSKFTAELVDIGNFVYDLPGKTEEECLAIVRKAGWDCKKVKITVVDEKNDGNN